MDRETLRTISPEQYLDIFEENVFDEIETVVNLSKGHCKEMHVGLTDAQMLERVIKEDKQVVSSFYNEETMKENLADALYYKSKDIAAWMTKERYEFKNPLDFHTYAFQLKLGGDPIGNAFGNDFKERESDSMVVVLQRSLDDESPFGFFVKTAYVDGSPSVSVETGKRYSKEDILSNPDIAFEDKWEKLKFIVNDRYKKYNPVIKINNGEKSLRLTFNPDKETVVHAYFNENDTKIKEFNIEKSRKLSFTESFYEYPDIAEIVSNVDNIKREIERPTIKVADHVLGR